MKLVQMNGSPQSFKLEAPIKKNMWGAIIIQFITMKKPKQNLYCQQHNGFGINNAWWSSYHNSTFVLVPTIVISLVCQHMHWISTAVSLNIACNLIIVYFFQIQNIQEQ